MKCIDTSDIFTADVLNAVAADKARNPEEYGVSSFEAYWAASASASVMNHYATGNVREVKR